MKSDTKKLVVTVINVVIFVCNAIISFLGSGGDISQAITLVNGVNCAIAAFV